ncbi:hypothetical protein [Gemmatimonas sp.]|jgi:hypothetical protein|uniref:hypothetical protein n=1 Tax=Gemmatimonas sp. TaxID=1962908 RepID=UPI0025B85BE1|nr:hypothetical protein [Gemmatimonas sp.]MCA2990482.1 hypothetical protein [Gemmatimonas sp.]MCE2954709.1 hypothetical protein [Gemmatimonas sp.]
MVPFPPPRPAWRRRLGLLLGGALSLGALVPVADAQAPAPSAQLVATREAQERELRALAEVHRTDTRRCRVPRTRQRRSSNTPTLRFFSTLSAVK